MIPGLRGSLLSHDAMERALPDALAGQPGESDRLAARREFQSWLQRACAELGPASGPRVVFDRIASPLAAMLGYRVVIAAAPRGFAGNLLHAWLYDREQPAAAMLVCAWGTDAAAAWRVAVRHGITGGTRWCLCCTGPALALFDARRTYSRRHAEIDLRSAANDPATFAILRGLLSAGALTADPGTVSRLDSAVRLSEEHRVEVRGSLQRGVHDALTSLIHAFGVAGPNMVPSRLFDESLVVIYRILFLLFAEARGLVPRWHPIYRDSYTIEALRAAVERRQQPRGTWEALQAIARLAHRGCRAGTLRVPPFNGRLFSPAHAPLADSTPLDDVTVRNALTALTTRRTKHGLERISYADLGVEQLGGVYERVLDFEPAPRTGDGIPLVRAERRKSTGSFYTPRALTEYLVRRTLAPLVQEAPPEQILRLRVLDPAMGSGAFLVAACRYLASAYETALLRERGFSPADITSRERADFRRAIAQRCLFGVDVNPMAVQLGRLSLWLATLASDRPLTFLDHHLRAGNSLLGASLSDLVRHPFEQRRGATRLGRTSPLPLFDDQSLDQALRTSVGPRLSIAADPDDTLGQVRAKERLLGRIDGDDGPLARWKRVADLWCARWFPSPDDPQSAARMRAARRSGLFGALADQLLGRGAALPEHVAAPLLAGVRAIAARERFFHWTLEFPEVFFAPDGRPLEAAGFDAVLSNPPWEMLRGDRGEEKTRRLAAEQAARVNEFARGSSIYRLQSGGQANLFQLFLERVLHLVRRGGRLGIVLPSGFAIDHGCEALRRHVLQRMAVDTFVSIENRDGLFPIHRSLRFLLLCATNSGETTSLRLHGGIRSADALDALPDLGPSPEAIVVQRSLVERFAGPQLAIPDLRSPIDVQILTKITSTIPPLGAPDGWNVRFGRELNASDDRKYFTAGPQGLPVIAGKHVQPFVADAASARQRIPRAIAARLLPAGRTFGRARLAYRDVAASSNRLTLIAAVVPAGVVTTHTLFCLKDDASEGLQHFLCGVFNSYVANYLVRLRVGTHVTTAISERLSVPVLASRSPSFDAVISLARALAADPRDSASAARLQAIVARLYGLTAAEFAHVLSTFPLIDADVRAESLRMFDIEGQ